MANKVSILIDADAKGFTSTLKGIGTSVRDAEGVVGKFKAGAQSAFAGLQQYSTQASLAAGAALVSFAASSVSAFQSLALEAGKFSDATGIGVENASRWIEVAGDIGIDAGTIQQSFQKMNKAIADGSPALARFGVVIARTDDGMVDANQTFLNAASTIGAIADPTERAKAAQEIFGRSYGQIAELLGMSASQVKKALDDVSTAKVIDEDELQRARDFRQSMDELSDALDNVKLSLGDFITGGGGGAGLLGKYLGYVSAKIDEINEGFAYTARIVESWNGEPLDAITQGVIDLAAAQEEEAAAAAAASRGLHGWSDAAYAASQAALSVRIAQDELTTSIADDQAFLSIVSAFDRLNDVLASTPNDLAAVSSATLQAKSAMLAYINQADQIPPEKKTEILTLINEGQLGAAAAAINQLTQNRVINIAVRFVGQGEVGFDKGDLDNDMRSSWAKAVGSLPKLSVGGGGGGSGGGGGGGGKSAADLAEEEAQHWDEIFKYLYDSEQRSLAEYREYLTGRLAAYEEFSDEWISIQRTINGLNEKEAKAAEDFTKAQLKNIDDLNKDYADSLKEKQKLAEDAARDAARAAQDALEEQDRMAAAQFEFGGMSEEDYRAYLNRRLSAYAEFSAGWVSFQRQINALDKEKIDNDKKIAEAEAERNKPIQGTSGLEDVIRNLFLGLAGSGGITINGSPDSLTVQRAQLLQGRQRMAIRAGAGLR